MYEIAIICAGLLTAVAVGCIFAVAYLNEMDRSREAYLSSSDNLLPSDGEGQ